MNELNQCRITELAEKLKNSSLSDMEFNELQQWIDEGYKNPELTQLMELHWKKLNKVNNFDVDIHQINEIYTRILLQIGQEEGKRKIKTYAWIQIFQKIAAILIIPVIIASIYYNFYKAVPVEPESWVEINSPEGSRTEFHLPDGSHGWLNGGSKLKYNPAFINSRKVELSGEAYFDISKQNGTAFFVNTSELNIKVLGTKFNVVTYPGEVLSEVVLEEGKIEASGNTKLFNKILFPGDKLDVNIIENLLKTENIEIKSYTAWKDGFLMLNDETLEQGTRRIEKWYNVDIEVVDDVLKKYRFKATFKDEPLSEVLRLLALTTPIDYEILPRKMDENGVYLKRKIIMKLKQ